jgi:cell division protein FtsB
MLFVAAALLYLYMSAGIHMLSTWSQSRHDSASVAAMERENVVLKRQHDVLGRRGTLEEEARRLGMIKQGEKSYIVSGLPGN